jgi:hypothetical protein
MAAPVAAERGDFGEVFLNGLACEQPESRSPSNATVCTVNGPDGFLSVRSGPGTQHKVMRNLKRFAVVVYDPAGRKGRWVPVLDAYRSTSPAAGPHPYQDLPVKGWAHDGYLCDFIH